MFIELASLNANEIVLDLSQLNGKIPCEFRCNGQLIGDIKQDKDGLIIDLKNTAPLSIVHASPGQNITIQATGKIIMTSAIELNSLSINCDELVVDGNIKAKSVNLMATKLLAIKNEIISDVIQCKSQSQVVNSGKLIAHQKLKIRAKQFHNHGECFSNNKISVKSQNFSTESASSISSSGILKINSEELLNKGKLASKQMACLDAKNFQHLGELQLPSLAYLHATNLTMSSDSQLNIQGDQNPQTHARIKVDDVLSVKKNSKLNINDAVLQTRKLKISGNLESERSRISAEKVKSKKLAKTNLNKSFLVANEKIKSKGKSSISLSNTKVETGNIIVAEQSEQTTHNSILNVAKRVTLADEASLALTESELYTGGYQTSKHAKTSLKGAKLAAKIIKTEGGSSYQHSLVESEFYTDSASTYLDNSRIVAKKNYDQQPVGDAVITNQSIISAPHINLKGKMALQEKSAVRADTIVVSGAVKASDSAINAKILNENQAAKIQLNQSAIFSENIIAKGTLEAQHSLLQAKDLTSEGMLKAGQSTFKVENRISARKETILSRVNLEGQYINLDGRYQIESSQILCDELQQQGEGSLKNNKVKVDRYDLSKSGSMNFEHNEMSAKNVVIAGNLNSLESKVDATNIFQDHGNMDLVKSRFEAGGLLFSQSDGNFNSNNSFLKSQDALFESKVHLSSTLAEFDSVGSRQSLQMQNSKLTVKHRVGLQGDNNLTNSIIETDGLLSFSGNMHANSSLLAAGDQVINSNTQVSVEKTQLKANTLEDFGELSLQENSELRINNHVDIYKKLKLDHSNLYSRDTVVRTAGDMSVKEALVKTGQLDCHNKLQLEKAKVDVDHARLACGSQLSSHQSTIEAKEDIKIGSDSKITGTSLVIKSTKLDNDGEVKLKEALHVDADYTYNFGTLSGGKLTTVTSNRLLLNCLGSISGKNTDITAVANINLLSSLHGSDSLAIRSLVDFNGISSYSGYNVSVNNVLGVNAGFVMPSLPGSWSAIVNSQHVIGVARAGLTTFFPQYTNLINLGAQVANIGISAIPAIKNKAIKIYDAYKTGGSVIDELLPDRKLFSSDARIVDWIPTALTTYNTAMMGYGLYKTANAIKPELQSIKDNWNEASKDWALEKGFENFSNIDWGQYCPEMSKSQWQNFAYAGLLALGPTQSIQSVININMGANFSNSVNQTGLVNINSGFSGATQVYNRTDYLYGANYGMVAADRATLTGEQLDQRGFIYARDSLYVNYNNITSSEHSVWQANNANIFATNFKEQGREQFGSLNGRIANLEFGPGSNVKIDAGLLSTDTLTVAGDVQLENFHLDNKEAIKVCGTGVISVHQSHLKTENIDIADNGAVKLNYAHLDAKNEINLAEQAQLDLHVGSVKAKSASLSGNTSLQGAFVETETFTTGSQGNFSSRSAQVEITLEDGTKQIVEQSCLIKANNATLAGQNNLSSTLITAQEQLVVAGAVNAEQVVANAHDLVIAAGGNLDVSQSAINTNKLAAQGQLNSDRSVITAESFDIKDQARFNNSHIKVTRDMQIGEQANVNAAKSYFETDNFINSGDTTLQGSIVNAQNKLATEGKLTTEAIKTAIVNEDGTPGESIAATHLQAKQVVLAKDANLTDTHVKADETIDVSKGANVTTEQVALSAKKVSVAGTLNANHSHIKTDERINVLYQGNLNTDNSLMQTSELNNFGNIASLQSQIEVAQDVTNHAGGNLKIEESNLNARNQNNNGSFESKKATLDINGKFIQDKDADSKLVETHVKAAQKIQLDGEVNLDRVHLESQNSVNIADTAHIKGSNSLIEGQDIQQNGELEYSGYLGLKARNTVDTGVHSSTHSIGRSEENLLDIQAKTANLSYGKVNVDNVNIVVEHLPGAENFIARKGKYANFLVSDNLSLTTQDIIDLSAPLKRECGLDITAKSIAIRTDYKTNADLHFKSTAGDVRLFSNLQGRNIYVESEHNLFTTNNINANQKVIFSAKGDFDNVGGNISADIISCQAARLRNLSGEALKYSDQKKAEDERNAKIYKRYHKKYDPQDPLLGLDEEARANHGNGGAILGREVYLNATDSNIENYGGVIKGTDYFQGVAKNDIVNRCNIIETEGKYDTIKTFDKGIMGGGRGLNGDGIGMYLDAGGHVSNIGSTFASEGSNYIHATKGFDSRTQHHTYIAKRKKESTWYGNSSVKIKTDTNIGIAEIVSMEGENIIIVDDGKMYGEAVHFISQKGTKAFVNDDIELYDLVYAEKSTKKKGYLWGAISSSSKEYHEYAEPVRIYDHGVSVLNSAQGNVICRGLIAEGNGDFYTTAKNGSVNISSQKLKHSIHEKSRSVGVSVPMYDRIKGLAQKDSKGILFGIDPTLRKVNSLINSNGSREFFANSWNTAISSYNSYQNVMFAHQNGMLGQYATSQFSLGSPEIDFTYTQSDVRINYETQGPGHVSRSNWYIEAGNDVNVRGVDVNITGDMSVQSKKFVLEGHELHKSTKVKQDSITVGVGAEGVNHVSGSHQSSSVKEGHFQNQQTNVGGTLTLNVDEMNLKAANVDTGDIQGRVNVLNVVSTQDTVIAKQKTVSFDSNGQGAYQESLDVTRQINQASGIHVRNGINHDEQHQLSVGSTTLAGAKITSDGVNNYKSDAIVSTDIKDYHKGRSIGFSGNLNDIVNVISPPDKNAPRPTTITTVAVTSAKANQVAVQHATIFGEQGTGVSTANLIGRLNTQNAQGYEHIKDKQQQIHLDVPVFDAITPVREQFNKRQVTVENNPPVVAEESHNSLNQEKIADIVQPNVIVTVVTNDSPADIPAANVLPDETAVVLEVQPPGISHSQTEVVPAAAHHSNKVAELATEAGLKLLGVAYEETAEMLQHCGEKGVARIFTGLGLGVNYVENLLYAHEHGSKTPAVDAMLYTALGAPNLFLKWFVKIPLDITADLNASTIDHIEKNNFEDFSSELGKRYWHLSEEEQLRLGLNLEDLQRQTIVDYYALAKAVEFASKYDKKIGDALIEWWRSDASNALNPNSFFQSSPIIVNPLRETPTLQPSNQ